MRGSMKMTPAASITKVGKWAIMGLSQPNKSDHRAQRDGRTAATGNEGV